MNKFILLLSAITISITSSETFAECLTAYKGLLNDRDHMLASMLNEEGNILSMNRSLFYAAPNGGYGEAKYPFQELHLIDPNTPGEDAMITTEIILAPALTVVYYAGNTTSSTSAATTRKISVSEYEEAYELIVDARIGQGKNLQKFSQELKDHQINITTDHTASLIARDDANDVFCKNSMIMTYDQIKNQILEDLGSEKRN